MSAEEPSRAERKRGDWLCRPTAGARKRTWALEEQLLAPLRSSERERMLSALRTGVRHERAELAQLEDELEARRAHLATLESDLRELTGGSIAASAASGDGAAHPGAPVHRATVELGQSNGGTQRDHWLCRCHGFDVYAGPQCLGSIEGVRFGSRVDSPDLLEVRSGRFRHHVLLIPTADVEDVRGDEEVVVLRSLTWAQEHAAHALLNHLRERLHRPAVSQSNSVAPFRRRD